MNTVADRPITPRVVVTTPTVTTRLRHVITRPPRAIIRRRARGIGLIRAPGAPGMTGTVTPAVEIGADTAGVILMATVTVAGGIAVTGSEPRSRFCRQRAHVPPTLTLLATAADQ